MDQLLKVKVLLILTLLKYYFEMVEITFGWECFNLFSYDMIFSYNFMVG